MSEPSPAEFSGIVGYFQCSPTATEKSLADERHTQEQLAQMEGERLVSFSLKHSLFCPSHQFVCFPKLDQILPVKVMVEID